MVVGVWNFRPPLKDTAVGVMISAFAWELLDLDSCASSAGRSCVFGRMQ